MIITIAKKSGSLIKKWSPKASAHVGNLLKKLPFEPQNSAVDETLM
jgi:hypothetical protein